MAPAKNPYEVLRVPPTASQQEIEAAYRRLTALLGDDTLASYGMLDPEQGQRMREELDDAFAQLGEAQRRSAFDRAQHPWAVEAHLGRDLNQLPSDAERERDHAQAREAAERRERLEAQNAHELAEVTPLHEVRAARSAPEASAHAGPRAQPSAARPPRTPRSARPFVVPSEALPKAETPLTGALLRSLREAAEASLDDLSDATKINRRYLIALENDDFALLPAGVYVRGFIGEYVRALGLGHHSELDPKALIKSYLDAYQQWRAER